MYYAGKRGVIIKKLIILILIVLFITGCNTTQQQKGNQKKTSQNPTSQKNTYPNANEAEPSATAMTDLEFAKTIIATGYDSEEKAEETIDLAWAIPMVIGYYKWEERRQKDYYKEKRALITEVAWNSPTMQFLINHSNSWHEPTLVEVLNIKVGKNRNIISGTLRINLIINSVQDKPAFIDFEVAKTPEGWKYTKLGKLVLRKRYTPEADGGPFYLEADKIINNLVQREEYTDEFSGIEDLYLSDFVLTLEDGKPIPPEKMIPTEYIWHLMFHDEISGFGLGMGDKLIQAVINNEPEGVITKEAQNFTWNELLKYGELWQGPVFTIKGFELLDRNSIRGTLRLFPKGFPVGEQKWSLLDFKLEKTENGWRYTNLSNLRTPKKKINN